jgi:integrase
MALRAILRAIRPAIVVHNVPSPTPGIRIRHQRDCAVSSGGRRCSCAPSFEASAPGGSSGVKVRKVFRTEAAARAWRRDALRAIARGRSVVPADVTVRELGDQLIAGMRDGGIRNRSGDRYKPSVIASYDGALQRHVLPAFGARKIGEVARRDVQQLVERLGRDGADPSTIRNALMPLRVIFRRALNAGEVDASPVAGVELPAVRGARERYATPEEAARLLAAVPEHDRALWGLAFYAGLRSGEIAALRWRDIDLVAGEIHVCEAWCHKTKTTIAPKSAAAVRVVPVPRALRLLVEVHLDLVDDPRPAALVAPSRAGRPFDPSTVYKRADAAWSAAGLNRITLHEARHTFASLMAEAGVPIEDLSEFMGHTSINVTIKRYRHLYPGARRRAADALDALLARADTAGRAAQVAASSSISPPGLNPI